MYDGSIGRFLERDPEEFAAGDANLYRYVKNDPLNATDPSGMQDRIDRPPQEDRLVPVFLTEPGWDRGIRVGFVRDSDIDSALFRRSLFQRAFQGDQSAFVRLSDEAQNTLRSINRNAWLGTPPNIASTGVVIVMRSLCLAV
jgi:uncharacterized protein RhaS with RHS repeats